MVERYIDVVDVRGSTPLLSTCIKMRLLAVHFYYVDSKKANCLAFVRSRIGVARSSVLGTHKTRPCDRTSSTVHMYKNETACSPFLLCGQ